MASTSQCRRWTSPPYHLLAPTEAEIHVWRIALQQSLSQSGKLKQLLSADECARADRFRFECDRQRFIVSHGAVRLILGNYLHTAPERLQFRATSYGKPYLAPTDGMEPLAFNLSHAGDFALCAVGHQRAIGIDIERLRPIPEAMQIAEQFFAGCEQRYLASLSPVQQIEAFFDFWTCKEAFLKARGDGLLHPLDKIVVELDTEGIATLARIDDDPYAGQRWSLGLFTPARGYTSSLVVQGSDPDVRWLAFR